MSVSEVSQEKEQEEDIIRIQAERLQALTAELKAERTQHQLHLMDCELQKQQQAYISEIMKEKDKISPVIQEKICEKDSVSYKVYQT